MARGQIGVPPEILLEAAEPVLERIRADAAKVPPVPVGRLLGYIAEHLFSEELTIKAAKAAMGVRGNRVLDLWHRQLRCAPRRYLDDRRAEVADRLRERMPGLSLGRIAEAIGFKTPTTLSAALDRWRVRRAHEQEAEKPEPALSPEPEPPTLLMALGQSPAARAAFAKDFARKVTLEYLASLPEPARQRLTTFPLRGPALFRALLRVSREGCRDDRKLGAEVAKEALAVLRARCRHLSVEERAHLEIEGLVWLGHACRLAIDLPGAHAALRDARGELRRAEERFVAARVGFQSTDDVVTAGVVTLDQAILLAETGRLTEVPALVAEVLPMAEALNLVPDRAEALRLLRTALGGNTLNLDFLKQIRDRLGPDVGAPGPFRRRRGRNLERSARPEPAG